MCTVLGISSSWWSVAGIILEIAGFVYLTAVAISDLSGKFLELVLAIKGFEIDKIKDRQDLETSVRLFNSVIAKHGVRKLQLGGLIIIISLVMQLVGSWPC